MGNGSKERSCEQQPSPAVAVESVHYPRKSCATPFVHTSVIFAVVGHAHGVQDRVTWETLLSTTAVCGIHVSYLEKKPSLL